MNTPTNLHNHPPDPIDEALAPYADDIGEADSWLDGQKVGTEAAMHAVDALAGRLKAARKAVEAAEESEAKPYYDMWKRAKARFAPTIADLDARVKGLVALVDSFKRRLAEEKAEAERKARAEADAARRAAEQAARRVDASDLATVRAAQEAQRAAEEAADRAARASRDKVKGLRTVTRYEIVDHRKLLHFIVANDCDAVAGFVDAWAAKHYKDRPTPDGLNVWQTKEAF